MSIDRVVIEDLKRIQMLTNGLVCGVVLEEIEDLAGGIIRDIEGQDKDCDNVTKHYQSTQDIVDPYKAMITETVEMECSPTDKLKAALKFYTNPKGGMQPATSYGLRMRNDDGYTAEQALALLDTHVLVPKELTTEHLHPNKIKSTKFSYGEIDAR